MIDFIPARVAHRFALTFYVLRRHLLTFAANFVEAVQVFGAESVSHALTLPGTSLQSSEMAARVGIEPTTK